MTIFSGEEMRIEIKDLNRIENQDNIVNKLCELDTRAFSSVFRASLKIRKVNKTLENNTNGAIINIT